MRKTERERRTESTSNRNKQNTARTHKNKHRHTNTQAHKRALRVNRKLGAAYCETHHTQNTQHTTHRTRSAVRSRPLSASRRSGKKANETDKHTQTDTKQTSKHKRNEQRQTKAHKQKQTAEREERRRLGQLNKRLLHSLGRNKETHASTCYQTDTIREMRGEVIGIGELGVRSSAHRQRPAVREAAAQQ